MSEVADIVEGRNAGQQWNETLRTQLFMCNDEWVEMKYITYLRLYSINREHEKEIICDLSSVTCKTFVTYAKNPRSLRRISK